MEKTWVSGAAERLTGWADSFFSPKPGTRTDRLLLALYYLEFAAIFALLMWKCRYGFADADENFFLSVPYRFVRGDRMLVQEWHLAQFGLFTLIPEMWLYLRIAGTTEGIFLAFRYLYTVMWCAGALFLYLRARKIHEYGARCASLFLECYAPFGIMAFSYNSLAILYLVNAAVFLLCAGRLRKVQFAVSGFFFAGAVLCCPYLALVYLIYTAVLAAARLRKKDPVITINQTKASVCWIWFTLGACVLAVIFLTWLFSGASVHEILEALPRVLSDAEHDNFSLADKTLEYFGRISGSNALFYPMLITVILATVLSLRRRRAVWMALVCAAVTLYLRRFLQEYGYMNFMMFPVTFAGIYTAVVTKDSRIRCMARLWLIPGLLYTYCLHFSSNQFFYAISSAASVSSAAGMIMMWMYCDELREKDRQEGSRRPLHLIAYAAVLICFVFQMRYEIPIRYQSVYWEPGLMKYEEQQYIDEGPEKGIIATVEKAERFGRIYGEVRGIDHRRLLVLSEQVWVYFVNDNENASYSGWLWRVNSYSMERLKEYYALRPEKKPEVVFVEAENREMLKYFDPEQYDTEELESGDCLVFSREAG